jgi:hypothetical protein
MLGADGFHVADGRQVELAIPFHELALIGGKGPHLPPGQVDIEERLRFTDQVFHARRL